MIVEDPSNGFTSIDVISRNASTIELRICDMPGREIYSERKANTHSDKFTFHLDTRSWSPGIYIYTLESKGKKISRQLMVAND
ncbi:MAG: T9SS C-terminal target domain-containing protein [Bacteroidetes bacterium]|nr:MAG: T9SS C-terminal target domain-containing protein [Bacteroidota bacterium]REK04728.1 MAG: T9SS C-terminal target domain-containing protein [Bacteroidota bacterium]REK36202.1 MAG: T9SS C-terminal target domain-containing protein [Bacteroidota bacterium]REK51427.1 MAG: T9SS C-terminal target domain-containing protein [Bacteroidota bacterium]